MRTGRFLWVGPAILLLASTELFAESNIDSRVQKLEETIRVLERRVTSLEDGLRERNASIAVPSDKASWRKLRKGMSEGDVEQLLGSPTRVDAFGPFTVWRYGGELSRGQVKFDANTRTVEGWHEP